MVDSSVVAEMLANLPSADDPWFPPRLNDYVFHLQDARSLLDEIVRTDTYSKELRFKAFYGFLNHTRRSLDFGEFDRYFQLNKKLFSGFPMLTLLQSQSYLNHIQNGQFSVELADRARLFADETLDRLPQHFGVQAHWTTVIAEFQSRLPNEDRDTELIKQALRVQEIAIIESAETYPRYFFTKAQLLRLLQRWDDAMAAVGRAIDREDSSLADYSVRVGHYQSLRSEIEADKRMTAIFELSKQELQSLRERGDEVRQELRETRASTLTLVSLLAAGIAFITTNTILATRVQIDQAMKLIGLSTSGILIVYASLLWLVSMPSRKRPSLRPLAVIIAGLVLAALTFLLPHV